MYTFIIQKTRCWRRISTIVKEITFVFPIQAEKQPSWFLASLDEKKLFDEFTNPTKSNRELVYSAADKIEIHPMTMINFKAMAMFMAMSVSYQAFFKIRFFNLNGYCSGKGLFKFVLMLTINRSVMFHY